ncbi:hypothetical protein Pcinc_031475 [Petrolisthes cinctipes]|uniref:Uncharacterized protein n=1 Tax=Petrolisthes cinctipes TaxID=88211 RepID=A0AAE1EWJ8_PETCI|nr:hypothetical protein Pcinc_031475 [Petrolisthes cinctipes]
MAEEDDKRITSKRKRSRLAREGESLAFKTVKCKLSSLLLSRENNKVRTSIDKRVEVVSKMAFRASIFMEIMLERLLEGHIDENWPDLTRSNLYDQLFKRGSDGKKLTRPTRIIEELWEDDNDAIKVLRDNEDVPRGSYNSIGERAHGTVETAKRKKIKRGMPVRAASPPPRRRR